MATAKQKMQRSRDAYHLTESVLGLKFLLCLQLQSFQQENVSMTYAEIQHKPLSYVPATFLLPGV